MSAILLKCLSEILEKRAGGLRQEAQLCESLSRDLRREMAKGASVNQSEQSSVQEKQRVLPNIPTERKMFLRIKEASHLLGMSRSSLYKEITEGNLKIKKAGKSTLIPMSEIEDWIKRLS